MRAATASLAGLVLSFIACFILLVIAPLVRSLQTLTDQKLSICLLAHSFDVIAYHESGPKFNVNHRQRHRVPGIPIGLWSSP